MQGLAIVVNTTAEQEKRLEALLPWHRGHTDRDGKHPHMEHKRYAGMSDKHPCKRTG